MKTFTKQCAQGDVMFTRVRGLPTDREIERIEPEAGHLIITHSETGHHHVMNPNTVRAYQDVMNAFVLYLVVEKATELMHLRENHTHESIMFEPGTYRVNRQREWRLDQVVRALD